MAVVTVQELSKSYEGERNPAVKEVSFTVGAGEFMVLLGPSGCGKSSVLRMIAGIEPVTAGKISIDGKVINALPAKDRDIAMVFQSYALYPHMDVFDNLAFGLRRRLGIFIFQFLARHRIAGRLAATIAHEIHNPLDSVSNLLFLMDGQSTKEESEQFLQLAKGEIARVTQISRAMLSLYREAKAPVAIDIKEMLESILLLMDRRFVALGVTVAPDLPEGLIIQGFPAELRQVFTNLLTNAAEAAGAGGEVSVTAHHTKGLAAKGMAGPRHQPGVLITISDNGPGIADEVRTQLFQLFFPCK